LLPFDEYADRSPLELLESHICGNWRFDEDHPAKSRCLIPSLVPPLRLKPILSKEYIDLWYRASQWLNDAAHVVILGYSLNTADEHFNDLLRSVQGRHITVVGPNVLTPDYLGRVSSVWSTSVDQFTGTRIQGKEAKQAGRIRLIAARADELALAELGNGN
jgi:hypothetical protein